MTNRPVLELLVGDVVRLKRRHPCGNQHWLVDRLGADIGLRCEGCGRRVLLDRRTLERRFDAFARRGDAELTAALAPPAPDTPAADPSTEADPMTEAEPTTAVPTTAVLPSPAQPSDDAEPAS